MALPRADRSADRLAAVAPDLWIGVSTHNLAQVGRRVTGATTSASARLFARRQAQPDPVAGLDGCAPRWSRLPSTGRGIGGITAPTSTPCIARCARRVRISAVNLARDHATRRAVRACPDSAACVAHAWAISLAARERNCHRFRAGSGCAHGARRLNSRRGTAVEASTATQGLSSMSKLGLFRQHPVHRRLLTFATFSPSASR